MRHTYITLITGGLLSLHRNGFRLLLDLPITQRSDPLPLRPPRDFWSRRIPSKVLSSSRHTDWVDR